MPQLKLIGLVDIYERSYWVAESDYDNYRRYPVFVPLRFKTGKKYVDAEPNFRPDGGTAIHRGNIAFVYR